MSPKMFPGFDVASNYEESISFSLYRVGQAPIVPRVLFAALCLRPNVGDDIEPFEAHGINPRDRVVYFACRARAFMSRLARAPPTFWRNFATVAHLPVPS
jgi:hypothetical protein